MLVNRDLARPGIYRAIVLTEDRVYIPGLMNITEINISNDDGSINEAVYEANKELFPIALWCAPNRKSTKHEPFTPCWVVCEGADDKRPIIVGFHGKGIKWAVESDSEGSSSSGGGSGSGSGGLSSASSTYSGSISVSGDMKSNAKIIWNIYHALGLSNINIAGILGNYEAECGIDATTIEAIFDESHKIGSRKSNAMADWNSYTLNKLFPQYEGKISINENAYKASDGKYYPGIGIGSYTGPNAYKMINFANSAGLEWYNIEAQIAYNLSGMGQYNFIKSWSAESSAANAHDTFGVKFEHSQLLKLDSMSKRVTKGRNAAQKWYEIMESEGWINDYDESAAKSILAVAGINI